MWYWILISGLTSGLLGVGISTYHQHRSETRRIKFQVLQQLLGNRNDLRGVKFTEAINQIPVTFSGCHDVLSALKAFHEVVISPARNGDITNQKLLDLFKSMCKHLKIDTEPLTDNYFLQAFNIKP